MAKEVEKEGIKEYVCEACGFRYPTQELAEKCEQWCTTHHSCNLEIIAQGQAPKEL